MAPQSVQKYRHEWAKLAEFKTWLQPCTIDATKAICKFCKCTLNAKLGDLQKHLKSKKHVNASKPFSCERQQKITNTFKPLSIITKKQKKEAQLSLYAAVHTSIAAVDHLSDLHKDYEESIHLHRTKCTSIIKNALGPHFQKELLSDIGNDVFSLILDESTDIAVYKMLGVVIRYFSISSRKIVSTYLGLLHIENGTADCLVTAIKMLLNKSNLNLSNLQGIGTDNASTMVGVNNGVFTKLKEEVPHLVLIRCVCHSLQLAMSAATKQTLPRCIDFLIKESYNWFSCSSIRQLAYREIYGVMNDGAVPLKIPKLADTRWLSIEPAVNRILKQWDSLKAHFDVVRNSENCFMAEQLYALYRDPQNKVYLIFLYTILDLTQKTNKLFEANNVDVTKLTSDLKLLYCTIVKKIVNPTARINIFDDRFEKYLDPNPYLGFAFENACVEANLNEEQKSIIKSRCIAFLTQFALQLKNRLPENLEILEKMNRFSVLETVKHNKLPISEIANFFFKEPLIITRIETQWAQINSVHWTEKEKTEEFWIEVYLYKDSAGENPFKELANLAFRILCLPFSNADVERLFSTMNIIKNKLRNKMKLPLLTNILSIKYGLKRMNKCCNSYICPDSVLKIIGTKEIYNNETGDITDIIRVCALLNM